MLTSRRLIQQGVGAILRDEIESLPLGLGDSVIVRRTGEDQSLRGPKFRLAYLGDAEGARAALERLR